MVLQAPRDPDYDRISVPPDTPVTRLRVPLFVGYWQLGGPAGIRYPLTRRPRWLTRRLTRWLLEWEWFDA